MTLTFGLMGFWSIKLADSSNAPSVDWGEISSYRGYLKFTYSYLLVLAVNLIIGYYTKKEHIEAIILLDSIRIYMNLAVVSINEPSGMSYGVL